MQKLIFPINKTKGENKKKQDQSGNPEIIEKDMAVFMKRILDA